MGALIFYGPGARSSAVSEAASHGRMLIPPAGGDGLKMDEAREITRLLSSPPMGDERGSVVIGPMDLADPRSSDVLLKVLEEHDEESICLVLWADDLEEVSPTIRSRCISKFSDFEGEGEEDPVFQAASDLFVATTENDVVSVMSIVREHRGKETELLLGLARWSEIRIEDSGLAVWEKIRPLCGLKNPTSAELLVALLPSSLN